MARRAEPSVELDLRLDGPRSTIRAVSRGGQLLVEVDRLAGLWDLLSVKQRVKTVCDAIRASGPLPREAEVAIGPWPVAAYGPTIRGSWWARVFGLRGWRVDLSRLVAIWRIERRRR